jgi:transglutaminase-like putative cysteine protease
MVAATIRKYCRRIGFPMSLLTVRHVTTYRYSEAVGLGEHRMMFRPRESHDLRLIAARLDIAPQPAQLRWVHDVFDNSVAVATFSGRTTELRFDSTVTLEHIETDLPDYALEPAAASYPFAYAADDLPDLAPALRRQSPAADIDLWATGFLAHAGSTDTLALLRAMTVGIREQLAYTRRIERGVQTPSETLRRGSGSCRDFALLMIDGARALGLAARFVSGYIFVPDVAPADEPAGMRGGGATHAWLQVYLPGAGWVDFDPTNSIIGNRNLIRVAVAWEPAQALPLWGSFIGYASAFLGMEVAVSVVDGTLPA